MFVSCGSRFVACSIGQPAQEIQKASVAATVAETPPNRVSSVQLLKAILRCSGSIFQLFGSRQALRVASIAAASKRHSPIVTGEVIMLEVDLVSNSHAVRLVHRHNGILSCFFHGFSSCLFLSLRSPNAILRRVECG